MIAKLRALFALLLSLVAASASALPIAPSLTDVPIRLYVSQAPSMLDNLAANPDVRRSPAFERIALQLELKSPLADVAQIHAIEARATALGIPTIPGFRCVEMPLLTLGAADPSIWIRNAAYLNALAKQYPGMVGRAVAFDFEKYAAGQPAPISYDAASLAMAPFIAAVRELGIYPIVYPADPRDFTVQVLGDAVGGRLELWTETTFPLAELLRTDTAHARDVEVAHSRVTTQFHRRWPSAVVRNGSYDPWLQTAGQVARATPDAFGVANPWIFPDGHDTAIGTPAWVRGGSASTNDVAYVWLFPPYATQPAQPSLGAWPMVPMQIVATPARQDIRSTRGWLASGGNALLAKDAVPKLGDLTVQVEAILPLVGAGPIVGGSQANSESWQVVYDSALDAIVLELRQPGPAIKLRSVMLAKPPRDVPIRVLVSAGAKGARWSWAVLAGGVTTTGQVLAPSAVTSAGHLWFAGGVVMGGSKISAQYEGLVIARVEEHLRELSKDERAAAVAGAYPR